MNCCFASTLDWRNHDVDCRNASSRPAVETRAYNVDWYRAQLKARDEEVARLSRALEGANRGAEKQRQERHHDVLCLVLKEMLRAETARRLAGNPPLNANFDDTMAGLVEIAERLADLAYPPPKGRL
jgi:hypothetical protein